MKLFLGENVEFFVTKKADGKRLKATQITGPSYSTVEGKLAFCSKSCKNMS